MSANENLAPSSVRIIGNPPYLHPPPSEGNSDRLSACFGGFAPIRPFVLLPKTTTDNQHQGSPSQNYFSKPLLRIILLAFGVDRSWYIDCIGLFIPYLALLRRRRSRFLHILFLVLFTQTNWWPISAVEEIIYIERGHFHLPRYLNYNSRYKHHHVRTTRSRRRLQQLRRRWW